MATLRQQHHALSSLLPVQAQKTFRASEGLADAHQRPLKLNRKSVLAPQTGQASGKTGRDIPVRAGRASSWNVWFWLVEDGTVRQAGVGTIMVKAQSGKF